MTEGEIRAVAWSIVSSAANPGGNPDLVDAVQRLVTVADATLWTRDRAPLHPPAAVANGGRPRTDKT